MKIEEKIKLSKEYYLSNKTSCIKERKENLIKLKNLLLKYKSEFNEAFKKDFNKCEFDVFNTEFLLIIDECNYMIKNINKLTKIKRKKTSIFNFPSKGYIFPEPYGVVLIISPWNYPLQLSFEPIFGAIAAGNTVILKPSSYSKNVSMVIEKLINEFNNFGLLNVLLGGRDEITDLLNQRFDYIFFTGSSNVGKIVLEKASKHLTPVSLELGGKSPCIVDKDANINLAAKRIVWGKFLNAGETCVAPDHILVQEEVKDEFIKHVKKYIKEFYYDEEGKLTENFPYIINEKHLNRVLRLIDQNKVIVGGKNEDRLLEPTVMDNVTYNDSVMKEEIFAPIMPILTFKNIEEVISNSKTLEKPLACYYFSKDIKKAKNIMNQLSFGGGAINETVMHLTNEELPFGGVGNSGMGSYHGKKSFETFSHYKSVLVKKGLEINIKYPPYTQKKFDFIKKFTGIK